MNTEVSGQWAVTQVARASELSGETPLSISWDVFYTPVMSTVSQATSDPHHSPSSALVLNRRSTQREK